MRSFGEVLKAQRRKLGLTQKQVADSSKVSDAYICSLESDKRDPPPYHTVVAIADALQLNVEQLWKVAVKHREKQAVKKSRRKTTPQRGNGINGKDDDQLRRDNVITVPDNQINAFFDRPEIQMTTFGLFQKQPKDMTMEEKRIIYRAISEARELISRRADEPTDSSSGVTG